MDKQLTIKMKALRFVKKHKKNTDRHTLIATGVLLFLLILFPAWNFFLGQDIPVPGDAKDTFTGSFVGDMAFNEYYDLSVAKGRDEEISRHLDGYLGTSDYIAGNIIGLTTDKETVLLKDFKFSTVNIFDDPEAANTDAQISDALETLDKNDISTRRRGFGHSKKRRLPGSQGYQNSDNRHNGIAVCHKPTGNRKGTRHCGSGDRPFELGESVLLRNSIRREADSRSNQ